MADRSLQRLLNYALRPMRYRWAVRAAKSAQNEGLYARAADHYRKALSLFPSAMGVKVQLANMLKDSNSFDEAEATYRSALADDPLNADTHLQLGHLLKLTGRRGLALAEYRKSFELDPLSAHAIRELAAAGDPSAQMRVYHTQMRQGGTEAVLNLSTRLAELSRQIDEIKRSLPDALAVTAFPVEAYAALRRTFDIPAPGLGDTDTCFVIVIRANQESLGRLHQQLSAVRDQSYPHWVLRVLGADAGQREVVMRAQSSDNRIAWVETPHRGATWQNEFEAARESGCDWTLLLGPTALLHRHALAWIAAAAERTGCRAMIMDEDVGDMDDLSGDFRPFLRQVVDPDTLREVNVYGENIAVKTTTLPNDLDEPDAPTPQVRHRLLQVLVSSHAVAHVPLPLVSTMHAPDETFASAPALARRTADNTPIAVIIPTKNNAQDLVPFVNSLISLARAPDRLEILILNNGKPLAEDTLLSQLAAQPTVLIYDIDEPFNWSRFNNIGVARVGAPYLVFANDDMLNLTRDWDDIIREGLGRADIGVVGARLVYPDDTLQHAGVLFDWRGSVIHDGLYRPLGEGGPAQRWVTTRSASAVTGAFLTTRRTDFDAVGGFDETHLAISYSDIDYCLKIRAGGRRILWTPHLTLRHFESKSRGLDHLDLAKAARDDAERLVMKRRWPDVLNHDPGLNPFWHQSTLPHRLLQYPSDEKIWSHIKLSAASNPWQVAPPNF